MGFGKSGDRRSDDYDDLRASEYNRMENQSRVARTLYLNSHRREMLAKLEIFNEEQLKVIFKEIMTDEILFSIRHHFE